jgi:hypothetical protein
MPYPTITTHRIDRHDDRFRQRPADADFDCFKSLYFNEIAQGFRQCDMRMSHFHMSLSELGGSRHFWLATMEAQRGRQSGT